MLREDIRKSVRHISPYHGTRVHSATSACIRIHRLDSTITSRKEIQIHRGDRLWLRKVRLDAKPFCSERTGRGMEVRPPSRGIDHRPSFVLPRSRSHNERPSPANRLYRDLLSGL